MTTNLWMIELLATHWCRVETSTTFFPLYLKRSSWEGWTDICWFRFFCTLRVQQTPENWNRCAVPLEEATAKWNVSRGFIVSRGIFNQGYLCLKCGLETHKECLGQLGVCGRTGEMGARRVSNHRCYSEHIGDKCWNLEPLPSGRNTS